jgi:outer membrane protein assembly factor BamA
MKNKGRKLLLVAILAALLFTGCTTTRYVPDGKYLLNDIDYKIDNREINKEELSSFVKQDENLKILGVFKFHLWLYNLSKRDKAKSWFREIGEPPVIYEEELKKKSVVQIQQYLYNKGYYQSNVKDTIIFKKKKAHITYVIQTGTPYRIRNISYSISDPGIRELVQNCQSETLIMKGDIFDVDLLDDERERIVREMNNNGYFRFVADYVYFNIDTMLSSYETDIEVVIENPRNSDDPSIKKLHRKYYIKDYTVSVLNPQQSTNVINFQELNDSLYHEGVLYRYNSKIPIKAGVISKTMKIKPGEPYRKIAEERTYNNLYSLRQFKYVNIQFQELEQYNDSLNGMLSGKIFLPMQVKQNYSIDLEGTNTSGIEGANTFGNFGIAGNLGYQHRNLFRGGEIFDLTFKGATERQVGIINDSTDFIMNELGAIAKLSVPGLIFKGKGNWLKLYSMPFTTFSLSYNYQERPDYTRSIINSTFGYQWETSEKHNHSLNIIDLNSVQIYRIDPDFLNSYKDLFIKSSFTDHIISATSYSFTYNTQNLKKSPDYKFFRMNVEVAGNTLWALCNITNQDKFVSKDSITGFESAYYKLFNTRFAQYVKGDLEYRYGYRFDKYNMVATRAFLGIACPYGNFPVTPPEKSYYTGGANGIRAWQVRTLGPGSYIPGSDEYPTGDIKIEANLEYRFKFFWMLEGALFLDVGNIWAINQSDNRTGAVFKFDRFYNEIAVGTGLGLRLVTNYFIIRTDLGLKLRDPARQSGERWIPGNRSFETSDLNLNIAIGYPF